MADNVEELSTTYEKIDADNLSVITKYKPKVITITRDKIQNAINNLETNKVYTDSEIEKLNQQLATLDVKE